MSASRKSPCRCLSGWSRVSAMRRSIMSSNNPKTMPRWLPVCRRKPCRSSCRRKGKKSDTLGPATVAMMSSISPRSPRADSERTSAMSMEKKEVDMRLSTPLCTTSRTHISSPATVRM
ncbi:Os02g0572000 [Oryza sativa Japonica Group]|uniref:Os02g0572000 protein n=2 Tax=Oryza sativa subsp. japonica TaxID=39947 RepID=A0A0P0VKV8_ORYSJ|nr:unknown protein [Oryza sativa Japonica Group]BAF09107.1 Os02g0572000 [Oryza sativa Japonica Group]BAS79350.1 Os02g0572000 [Oryza sativa Japonica Group]|eukprot:NP_001047193.1 Os02g0572000 [Oryza sativa Japonica Group]